MMKSNEPASKPCWYGLLEIEDLAFHLGKGRQFLHGCREEAAETSVKVYECRPRSSIGSNCGARPPVPAPTSRMRRPRPSGRCRAASLHRRRERGQPMAGEEPVAIKMIQQFRAGASEKHLYRFLFAAQNRSKLGAVGGAEQRLPAGGRGVWQEGALRYPA